MTERLYLHVGAPKSGTTYLQAILEGNRALLAERGVLVAGQRRIDRVHAAMAIREDSRLADLPPEAARAWDRLVTEIRGWSGPVAILSYELFAAVSRDKAARALAALEGIEVHVVITGRDYARAMPSAWQERLKFALTEPLATFAPDTTMGARAQWGWRTMDVAGVAQRWGETLPAEQVHVVTMPRRGSGPEEFWHRFAQACGLDSSGLRLDQERVNESMGVVEAELLRRVNEHLDGRIAGNREQARWLRDLLAHQVLAGLSSEPIAITAQQFAEAQERSERAITDLSDSGHQVHGDLEDLRATAPVGREPGEVTEPELLESALETIVRLLEVVRERSATPPQPSPATPSVGRLRRVLEATAGPAVELRRRRLERRVEEMDAELARARRLEQRVAELDDLVSELLLPVADQDGVVLEEALGRYREDSL